MAASAKNQKRQATSGRTAVKPNPDFGKNGVRPSGQKNPGPGSRGGVQTANRPQRSPQKGTAAVKRRKKRSNAPLVIFTILLLTVALVCFVYGMGYIYYKDKFVANTFINGISVGGKTRNEVEQMFAHNELPATIQITTPTEHVIDIPLDEIGYKYSYSEELDKIFDDIDRKSWFAFFLRKTDYSFTDVASYDSEKLMSAIDAADWGNEENINAEIKSGDEGYYVIPEVQGDVFDMGGLKRYIASSLDKADYNIDSIDSGAYVLPETVEEDYKAKIETLNRFWNMEINYDFNYTKEKLTGKKLAKMVKVKRDGSYTIDRDACMTYIEKLADKYDTYNTERKFKATIQGKITVPTSSDAKYGWWLDKEECCDQLVRIIEKGENRKKVTPIYYKQGEYEFSGFPSGRSEKDDIGNTYVEVDLTNQQFWVYKKGKKVRSGYIVSGQTTSAARTTLPGVYKVWQKDTNYRMKDSNADGEEWDTKCDYWTRIAIVGIGMHDSQWRGNAFGGSIYKYNGSHGCINMSLADAKYIYEKVAMGTPVVMYY